MRAYVFTGTSGSLNGKEWTFEKEIDEKETIQIGRDQLSRIFVDEVHISRKHAVLYLGDDISGFSIEDQGSLHGTFVDDGRAWVKIPPHQKTNLCNGAKIRLTAKGPSFSIIFSDVGSTSGLKQQNELCNNEKEQVQVKTMEHMSPLPLNRNKTEKTSIAGSGDLLAEFSELISVISAEVLQNAVYATALQEMKQINKNIVDLQTVLPRGVKEVEAASGCFRQARTETQQLLDRSSQNLKQQELQFTKHLAEITERYRRLADSLLETQQKALSGQTKQIQNNTDETIEQVHAAIVESQRNIAAQMSRIEKDLVSFRTQGNEAKIELGYRMERLEATMLQSIERHAMQLVQESVDKHRRLCWLAAGNMVLLLGICVGVLVPYLK